jgi:hypothetical protein
MFVVAFDRKSGVDPVLLALRVIPNVRVAQGRQFTGGIL